MVLTDIYVIIYNETDVYNYYCHSDSNQTLTLEELQKVQIPFILNIQPPVKTSVVDDNSS